MEDNAGAEAPDNAGVPAEGADAEALSQVAESPAPAAAPPAEAAPEVDLDEDAPEDIYSDPEKARKYAESLRKEAAKYRTKAKEAASPFEGWTEQDAKVLANVIQIAANDPATGAQAMREIADALDGGDVEKAAEIAAEASDKAAEAAKGLTPEDVDAKVKEALDNQERERAINVKRDEILSKTRDLGYDASPEASPEQRATFYTLIHLAQNETGGDLDKAHEILESCKQAAVDEYVSGVRQRAAGAPIHGAKPSDSVIEAEQDNKDWGSARKRMEQRIINSRGA